MTIFVTMVVSATSQSNQQCAGQTPCRVISDTNFMKNLMHLQSLGDTGKVTKFIIMHDTVYMLMLHSDVQMPEMGFPRYNVPVYTIKERDECDAKMSQVFAVRKRHCEGY